MLRQNYRANNGSSYGWENACKKKYLLSHSHAGLDGGRKKSWCHGTSQTKSGERGIVLSASFVACFVEGRKGQKIRDVTHLPTWFSFPCLLLCPAGGLGLAFAYHPRPGQASRLLVKEVSRVCWQRICQSFRLLISIRFHVLSSINLFLAHSLHTFGRLASQHHQPTRIVRYKYDRPAISHDRQLFWNTDNDSYYCIPLCCYQ